MNITVVTGHLTRPPERRTLPSGEVLLSADLRVVGPDERSESLPVAWPSPSGSAEELPVGEPLLVLGRVRRRFFRTGGSTQSRTEVVAAAVVPLRRTAAVRRLLASATAELAEGAPAPARRGRTGRVPQVEEAS